MSLQLYRGGLEELRRTVRETLAPAPQERVYQWLERHCSIRGEAAGKFNTERTPYVREFLDNFANKRIEDLTACWGTQTTKTTCIMGGVAYRLVNDPQDALWVMPDKDLAASFSRNRWQPYVESCGPLRDQKPEDPNRFTNMEQAFSHATLFFVGSNSPAQVSSRPCGLVCMDEVDKFGIRTEKEAGALENAEERSNTFNYPLHVKTSTPTTFYGAIWQEFLLGDQRYYWIPCPRCDQFIKLQWKQLRWWKHDEGESKTNGDWDFEKVRRNTRYVCQECEGEIRDHEKHAMLQRGEWRPENDQAPLSRRSYHLNTLYAPWKKVMWPHLAVRWLQSKSSITRRHRFINSTLAEIWDGENAYDDDPISSTPYLVAEIQRDRTPLLTFDVQDNANHFWFVARSWASSGESWLLECGRVESLAEIEHLQGKWGVEPNNVIFDLAHKTNLISKWMVDHDWRGAWGQDKKQFAWKLPNGNTAWRIVSQPKNRDPHLGTVLQSETNPTAVYVEWANDPVKDILAILRDSEPHRFHIFPNVPIDYIKHSNAEKKIAWQNPRTGKWSSLWRQLKRANHLNDCECMQIVGAIMRGLITDDHYDYANAQGALKLTEQESK